MELELDELLDKNNLTRKDVKHHNAEYYPSGQVKMKILYLGTWGKRKCYDCGWLDYDEQGNQMIFNTKEDRLNWICEIDMKYRQEMDEEELEENEGIVFPEAMPSKKTGKTYKDYNPIIEALKPYWNWRVNDVNMPKDTDGDYHTRKTWFYKLAEDFDLSFDRISQIERKFFPTHKPEKIG